MVEQVFRNLVENPSFEYGTEGWSAIGTLSVSSSYPQMWQNTFGGGEGDNIAMASASGNSSLSYLRQTPDAYVDIANAAWLGVAALVANDTPAVSGGGVRASVVFRNASESTIATEHLGSYINARFYDGARLAHAVAVPSGAVTAELQLRLYSGASGTNIPEGDRLWVDGVIAVAADSEQAALEQVATYFDGDTPNSPGPDGYGWVYEWDGEPGASSSTKSWGQAQPVAVRVVEDLDAPAVGITVEGLSATESSRIAIYRQTPGKERTLVQGLGNVDVDGAGYWVDYLPPLGVPVTYVVEVLEGDPLVDNEATITIPSSAAWLQDALNPLLAVEVACRPGNRDTLFFTAEAFTAFERPTNSDLVSIMGGRVPVGMTSRRQTPVGIPFNMVTTAAEASSLLREVLIEGTHLVLRVPPEISMLDPVTYLSDVQVSEEPSRQSFLGGHVIRWNMTGSQTRGPRIMAWTALWTYDDVAELYAGYSYTDLVDGRRYVQWQANPDDAQLAGFSTTSGGGADA